MYTRTRGAIGIRERSVAGCGVKTSYERCVMQIYASAESPYILFLAKAGSWTRMTSV